MDLNDIIKTDKDRLFQVDDECYVLFTGDSLEDEQPFIRIGNWVDMPAELIPLIRNIVITDNLTGNPACEQFNIDPDNLQYNRYIGSSEVMRPYIEFQKLLGIDLSKVEIVDIKKDLPEFSMGKNMSDDDQFIGVFYRDGSFKTLHKGNTILDLKDKEPEDFFENFFENNPKLLLLDGNLTFVGEHSSAISYGLPPGGINRFKEHGINSGPEAFIHPANNYINLISFLKNKKSGKITIFTSKNDDIRTIKKLFSKLTLNISDIANIRYGSSADLLVENYPGSVNIRAVFGNGPRIAFAKSAAEIRQVLKDKLDGIIISYSAYKESVLLFKSTPTPIAIVNDTNENIHPKLAMNIIPLMDNSLYRLLKSSPEELSKHYGNLDELTERLKTINPGIKAEHKELFNIMSLIRLKINSSIDRAQYRDLQKLYYEFQPLLKPYNLFGPEERPAFTLAFCESGMYQFADTVTDKKMAGRKKQESEKNLKIAQDRERLERLLALYLNEGSLGKEKTRNALETLRGSLKQRKETHAANIANSENSSTVYYPFSNLSKMKSALTRFATAKTGDAKKMDTAFYEKSMAEERKAANTESLPPAKRHSLFSNLSKMKSALTRFATAKTGDAKKMDTAFYEKSMVEERKAANTESLSPAKRHSLFSSPSKIKSALTRFATAKTDDAKKMDTAFYEKSMPEERKAANTENLSPVKRHSLFSSLAKMKSALKRFATAKTDDAKKMDTAFYEKSMTEERKAANTESLLPAKRHSLFSSLSKMKSALTRFATAKTDDAKKMDTAFYEKSMAEERKAAKLQTTDILSARHLKQNKEPFDSKPYVSSSPSVRPGRKKAALVIAPLALIALFFLIWRGQKTDPLLQPTDNFQNAESTGKHKVTPSDTIERLPDTALENGGKRKVTPSDAIFDEQKKISYEAVPAKFKSTITPADIYDYTNKVAVKNGYRELSAYEMKYKNPNRIFPQETFSMLDGQIITVVNRDTLWNISERKLMDIDLTFYETIKQIESAPQKERKKLIERARSLAFSKSHKKILDSL